jgi:two-component SAPR family response regulator
VSLFAQQNGNIAGENHQNDVKNACLSATITAIQLETARVQQWVDLRKKQGSTNELATMQEMLRKLHVDMKKYQVMNVNDYLLPNKTDTIDDVDALFSNTFVPLRIETIAWVEDKPAENSILYVENMTKSGPWYHIAGIMEGDYTRLQPNIKYHVVFYTIYKRSYWNMSDSYICITEINK